MNKGTSMESPQETAREGIAQPDPERDPAAQSGTHAPGGNRLNDIADEDIDKVVPREPKETAQHDHALGDADERDQPDESGEIPRPL